MRTRLPGRLLRAAGVLAIVVGLFGLAVSAIHQRDYRALNEAIAPPGTPDDERVLRTFELVSRWEYFDPARIDSPIARLLARLEHASPLHLTAWSVLRGGVDRSGPCGGTSRTMIVLLREAGIPSRKAILYRSPADPQHTVVEVFLHGEWRVFDPTYAHYWRRDGDGDIATVADLAGDPSLLRRILDHQPHYPVDAYHYGVVHRLRWEKVPGLGAARSLLRRVKGDAWVREVPTPYAYERPYATFGGAALLCGIALVLAAQRRAVAPQ